MLPKKAKSKDGRKTYAHNQHSRRIRGSTENRANLENEQGHQKGPLQAEEAKTPAKRQLEGTFGEQIRRAVPAHILQRVELVRDARDGGGDDGAVQRDAEQRDEEGE